MDGPRVCWPRSLLLLRRSAKLPMFANSIPRVQLTHVLLSPRQQRNQQHGSCLQCPRKDSSPQCRCLPAQHRQVLQTERRYEASNGHPGSIRGQARHRSADVATNATSALQRPNEEFLCDVGNASSNLSPLSCVLLQKLCFQTKQIVKASSMKLPWHP